MKFIVPTIKPRNPLVAASLRRRAGTHARCGGALRQQSKRDMQRELLPDRPPCR
jgi:hypothetical protein